jgi:hypothetical protein
MKWKCPWFETNWSAINPCAGTFRREFRKWQVLLNGKSPHERLWSVRPPRGGLTHRFILAWAQNALQLAGYDPRNMLTEWHIFWRRKGV